MSLNYNLEMARDTLDQAIKLLEDTPEKVSLATLITHCRSLDEYYKKWCAEQDADYAYEAGTTYEEGACMEFYIESDLWHDISLALRELDNN